MQTIKIAVVCFFALLQFAVSQSAMKLQTYTGHEDATQGLTSNVSNAIRMSQAGIRFQENRGQVTDAEGNVLSDIAYIAQTGDTRMYFRSDGISYVFTKSASPEHSMAKAQNASPSVRHLNRKAEPVETYRIDMHLPGCNPNVRIRAEELVEGYVNYYHPHHPQGILGVREYRRIVYENIYDRVDLELISSQGRMKYNFVVRPGGDPEEIQMKYEGATDMMVTADGKLRVGTPLGGLQEAPPLTYVEQTKKEILSNFRNSGDLVSFSIADYDPAETLIIDPWVTYYGGSDNEWCGLIATDGDDNVFICGDTYSSDFPTYNGFQNTKTGSWDAFLVKFNSDGDRLWATYFGGSNYDWGWGVATDADGNVFLGGGTRSNDLPVSNAAQKTWAGGEDIYIAKFSDSGTLFWATYYGGANNDYFGGFTTDSEGNIIATGNTDSPIPIVDPLTAYQSASAGDVDAFIIKYDGNGIPLWSTYYGGSSNDNGNGVCVDGSDNIFLVGGTSSNDLPVLNPWQSTFRGNRDLVIAKFTASGGLDWATYYGDTGFEDSWLQATDTYGAVYMVGWTTSSNFPTVAPYQSTYKGSGDAIIVKLNATGGCEWATFYGGTAFDILNGVAIDASGNVAFSGTTRSTDFPVYNALQGTNAGGYSDAVLVKFDNTNTLLWSTYFGGSDWDDAYAVVTDSKDNIIACGYTYSTDLPDQRAFQPTNAGNGDAFVISIAGDGLLNHPPEAKCTDITLDASASCNANGSIDNGSFDPDGDPIFLSYEPVGPYPLGTVTVKLTVQDDLGWSNSCTGEVTVRDVTPPVLVPQELIEISQKGGNDNYWEFDVSELYTSLEDNCDSNPTVVIHSVSCNEGIIDDEDILINPAHTKVELRRERDPLGIGRFYKILMKARDFSDNTTDGTCFVCIKKGNLEVDPESVVYLYTVSKQTARRSPNPRTVFLDQSHPNPFNPMTTIEFGVTQPSNVRLRVFDLLGREVAVLVDERRLPGIYSVNFDGTPFSSGTFMYRLESNGTVITKKMTLLK